ncbi:hypothetical protein [Staphylococcus caledonicus]|uniref:hypothetical protein n=1 Tax=Staphylococcus caledonicus TaxID=2741333 RepID=UPI0018E447D7|nr:hypothetical protein [Staphylococcus caledonicus]MBI5973669.1 hypothetical protein [Staphylococcus caledonicus]
MKSTSSCNNASTNNSEPVRSAFNVSSSSACGSNVSVYYTGSTVASGLSTLLSLLFIVNTPYIR